MMKASCLESRNRGLRTIEPRLTIVETVKRGYAYYLRKGKLEWDSETGCLLWMGSQYPDGYGRIRSPGRRGDNPTSRIMRAQRYFYELYVGSAEGYDVSHRCHRRLCVWKRHLVAERHSENMFHQYAHYAWGKSDRALCKALMIQGYDASFIAEQLLAPRLAAAKLMAEIGPQLNLPTFEF